MGTSFGDPILPHHGKPGIFRNEDGRTELAVEAVCCEPLSRHHFPVYREFTGNSDFLSLLQHLRTAEKAPESASFRPEYPT